MSETPRATGTADAHDPDWVVLERTFAAPIDVVWAALTEPDRLVRWLGTWSGDPSQGRIEFRMTAEGEDVPPETFHLDVCDPPRRLHLTTESADAGTWKLRLELSEQGGVTTLAFAQHLTDPEVAASVGPGWEYYLDRLVAAETGGDVAAIDFDDYYPSLSDHYRGLVG